jgi:NTP pyrophosphatase (non-canonical NTP hydrolase)
LNLSDYQQLAARTANTALSDDDRRLNCAMGLIGEFGELVDLLKKQRFHGHDVRSRLIDECGDVCWYLAEAATIGGHDLAFAIGDVYAYSVIEMAHEIAGYAMAIERDGHLPPGFGVNIVDELATRNGIDLMDVLEHNVAKLRARYPDGFDAEKSRNR